MSNLNFFYNIDYLLLCSITGSEDKDMNIFERDIVLPIIKLKKDIIIKQKLMKSRRERPPT